MTQIAIVVYPGYTAERVTPACSSLIWSRYRCTSSATAWILASMGSG